MSLEYLQTGENEGIVKSIDESYRNISQKIAAGEWEFPTQITDNPNKLASAMLIEGYAYFLESHYKRPELAREFVLGLEAVLLTKYPSSPLLADVEDWMQDEKDDFPEGISKILNDRQKQKEEKEGNKQEVSFQWVPAKASVARFVEDISNKLRCSNPQFRERMEKSGNPSPTFVYNLGHAARGMYDFPTFIQISVPNINETSTELSNGNKTTVYQVEMPLVEFISQFSNIVYEFLENHEFRRFHNDALELLCALPQYIDPSEQVKLDFSRDNGKFQMIAISTVSQEELK